VRSVEPEESERNERRVRSVGPEESERNAIAYWEVVGTMVSSIEHLLGKEILDDLYLYSIWYLK
jgi:hypothetical protein